MVADLIFLLNYLDWIHPKGQGIHIIDLVSNRFILLIRDLEPREEAGLICAT